MNVTAHTVLLAIAIFCFLIAAIPLPSNPINWQALGLAFLAGAFLVGS